jgi:xylulokinase
VCAELGICQRILPPICSPLDEVGQITADAERQTGLAQGTPVLAGTTDTFATLVGSGIVAQGEAMIYYGTTGLLTVCSQDLERVLARPDLVDDETPFVLAAYLLNFGEALEWFGEELLAQREQCAGGPLYAGLEAGAARLPAGSEGLMVLPHFAGRVLPHVDPHARGSFIGLSTRHSRSHLWRALLESFGFGIRQAQLGLEQRGLQLRRVVASGGGARSTLWRQIVTDITGLPQEYVQDGDTARGAAFLVGYALGLADSLAAIRDCWLHAAQVTQPQPQEHEHYKRLFAVYQALDMCLGPHYKTLAEASRFDLPGIN